MRDPPSISRKVEAHNCCVRRPSSFNEQHSERAKGRGRDIAFHDEHESNRKSFILADAAETSILTVEDLFEYKTYRRARTHIVHPEDFHQSHYNIS